MNFDVVRSCTSCPNWGEGGEVIWAIPKRNYFFFFRRTSLRFLLLILCWILIAHTSHDIQGINLKLKIWRGQLNLWYPWLDTTLMPNGLKFQCLQQNEISELSKYRFIIFVPMYSFTTPALTATMRSDLISKANMTIT